MASSAPDHLRTPGLISNRPCYEGIKIEAEDSPDGLVAITVTVVKGKEKAEEESEPGGEVLRYESTVASFSSSTLVLGRVLELYRTEGFLWRVVDEDELTFDITGA